MSPDWAAQAEPVPYAKLDNPQSLNLYGYMRNNPLGGTDPDGHSPEWWQKIRNYWNYQHAVTDADLNAALADDAAKDRAAMAKEGVMINGQSAADALNGKSNQAAVDAYNGYLAAEMSGKVNAAHIIPPGITTSEFGTNIMKWGTGDAAARSRMQTLTREELEKSGVTKEMAEQWRDFYKTVKASNPENPSAQGRAELMQRAVDLLSNGK